MKTNHTKGNWKIEKKKNIISEEGYLICSTYPNMPNREIKSNLKLIACAPEMLKTLNNIIHMANAVGCASIVHECRAMIKKATE